VKLLEIRRNTKVKIGDEVYEFQHTDGMYSLCYDKEGRPVHFAVWTDATVVDEEDNVG
jgi:hypothetical protein